MTGRRRRLPTWVLVGATIAVSAGAVALDGADRFPLDRLLARWSRGALPAVVALPREELLSGLPILSLAVDPADLYGPNGILDNRALHGPAWERKGSVAYFDEATLRFAAGVGVRVHGGGSRYTSPRQGFRLFFRHRFGPRAVPPGVLFSPDAQPIRRLVVHNDVRQDADGSRWHFVNPLAYDIARAMGAIAAETKPVRFFLNGEYYGPFVLTERFDQRYFAAHWGTDNIHLSQESFDAFWAWVDRTRPLTLARVASQADVENLTRWFLATAFVATGDAYQGPGQLLDLNRPTGGWFWVNWDMDLGLRDWDLDSYQDLLERVAEAKRGRNPAEPRSVLLTHLLAEDDGYRALYKRVFQQVMNHHVTEAFLDERYRHYYDEGVRLHVENVEYLPRLREFLDRRPAFFRLITEQWLNTPPSQPVTLRAPAGVTMLVDAERVQSGYSGWYFPDLDQSVEVIAEDHDGLVGWRVNGRVVPGAQLTFRADRPTEIEALFGELPADDAEAAPAPSSAPAPAVPDPAWTRIPSGSFAMGCVLGDPDCTGAERPRHDVRVEEAFEITAHEITADQFRAFANAMSAPMPRQPDWYADLSHPVVNMTWDEARGYCQWLGGDLPTEEQWEYAARGGSAGQRYPWGAEPPPPRAEDARKGTTPVGQSAPNAFGLYDTAGNVWEWTVSPFRPTYAAAAAGDGYDRRTVRGGSWDSAPERRRTSMRAGLSRLGRHNLYVGFRCVR